MAIIWCEKCLGIIQSGGEAAGGKICTCPPVFGPLKDAAFTNPLDPLNASCEIESLRRKLDAALLQVDVMRKALEEINKLPGGANGLE